MRRVAAFLGAVVVTGCHSTKSPPAAVDASAGAIVSRVGPVTPARFSRPIAAVRGPAAVTLVTGLVVPSRTIAVTALGPDGATLWTHDVIKDIEWSANATLNIFSTITGATVVWRGPRSGHDVTVAVGLTFDGKVDDEPYVVGAAACATDAELAWVDRGPRGTWLVKTRTFGASASVVGLTLPEDRDPALLCGARGVFALGDGDEDVTLSTVTSGAHAAPIRVMQAAEFRGDEERSHEVYAVKDVLGVVRIGLSGSVATREIVGRQPSPWRRFGRKLTEGDDVTLVDASTHDAILAFAHDPGQGDDTASSTVEAFVWERSGSRDASYRLAPADDTRVRGPFWSGAVQGGLVVGWAERGAHVDAGHAPIVGLAYRVVSIDSIGDLHRIDRPADELVDAGCDDSHCYAAALARASGEDGGQPEVAAVLTYP